MEEPFENVTTLEVIKRFGEDRPRAIPASGAHLGAVDKEEEDSGAMLAGECIGNVRSELAAHVSTRSCVCVALLHVVVGIELHTALLELKQEALALEMRTTISGTFGLGVERAINFQLCGVVFVRSVLG